MRKPIYFLAALAGAAFIIFVISCSKEEMPIQKDVKSNDPEALKAYNLIQQFKKEVTLFSEDKLLKSGETISVDSLLWNFNALINFDYADVDAPYKDFTDQTVYYTLATNDNGLVSLTEALTMYLQLENDVETSLDTAPYANKSVQFAFIKMDNISEETITLKSSISVGERGTDGNGPFGSEQDWMYGDDYGMCDGNLYGQMDGADAIEDMVESRRHLFINDDGVNVFYVNPVEIILDKDDIDANPILDLTNGQGYDNVRDYRIFYAHSSVTPLTPLSEFYCIENTDMNFYNNHMESLVYDVIPNNWPGLSNKVFVRFVEIDGAELPDGISSSYLIHQPTIVFAQRKIIEL